jgi:C4-dicarboxylate-specific signal transduction histidine kinase
MSRRCDIVGETALQFYGKICASLSHEIKNALAIINEDAGLLNDFAALADQGRPLDPERVKSLAGKVVEQTRRADGIVENMNSFAHSVDTTVDTVELGTILELVVALAGRFASMRGVALEQKSPKTRVMIGTNPFFLENLVWLCLDFAMDCAGEGKTVFLEAEETDKRARIRFTGLQCLSERHTEVFPGEREKALMDALEAKLTVDVGAGEVVLTMSRDISR